MCAVLQGKGGMTTKVIQRSSGLPPQFQGLGGISCFRFSGPDCSHLELGGWGPPPGIAAEVGSPQWIWKAEHRTKEDYSQASRSNIIYFMRFWNYLGSDTLFFLPISPFWNSKVYPVPVSPLYSVAHNLPGLTGSQLERNFASG